MTMFNSFLDIAKVQFKTLVTGTALSALDLAKNALNDPMYDTVVLPKEVNNMPIVRINKMYVEGLSFSDDGTLYGVLRSINPKNAVDVPMDKIPDVCSLCATITMGLAN